MTKQKDTRVRNWTFVVYPESAPENWREIIDELHVPWVESPLHDKDIDPDGQLKKPHWHVLMLFDGKKSYDQIRELTLKLRSPNPQKCANTKGMVRYFAHIDNPEKYQYDKSGIVGHSGADVAELIKPTSSDRYALIKEMRAFVRDNDVTEFMELFDYAADERFDDWFPLLCDNSAYIMGQYIRSNRHRQRKDGGLL